VASVAAASRRRRGAGDRQSWRWQEHPRPICWWQPVTSDTTGGTLAQQIPRLQQHLAEGRRRVVLDNTYPTRAARNAVIEVAWQHGVGVRCIWLQTSLEQSQINAVRRMLATHGRLLEPEEIKAATRRSDSSAILPRALFDYRRVLEAFAEEEGFETVERVEFEKARGDAENANHARPRTPPGMPAGSATSAVICGYQAITVGQRPLPTARQRLRELRAQGSVIAIIAWEPWQPAMRLSASQPWRGFSVVAASFDCGADIRVCTHPPGRSTGLLVPACRPRTRCPVDRRTSSRSASDHSGSAPPRRKKPSPIVLSSSTRW